MDKYRAQELKDFYYTELTEDIIPFWQKHALDLKKGGFYSFLDRQGELLSRDKSGSAQGRAAWTYSTLFRELEDRKEWLISARNAVRFIRENLRRKSDGRIFSEVTESGDPLILPGDLNAEYSAALGLAAYSFAAGDRKALEEARELYALIGRLEGTEPPLLNREVRPVKELLPLSRQLILCRELRRADPDNEDSYNSKIEVLREELFRVFMKGNILLESAGPGGEPLEGPKGRSINIGLSFEVIQTLMEEAEYRRDRDLMEKLMPLLDELLNRGWDEESGGFYSYVDSEGKQPAQLEWDMKIWWVHCNSISTLLLAYFLTGMPLYETWFETVQEYAWDHFPDREKKEWFAYLRRDGSVQMDLKGDRNKDFYHLPRFLIKTWQMLNELQNPAN